MGLVTISDLFNQPKETVVKYMSWAGDLGSIYEDFIRKDDEDVAFVAGWHGAKSRSQGIHASEMSGGCRRPVWYSITGVARQDGDLDPFWKKRFRIGHMYHAMVQEDWRRICEKSGGYMSFEKEVKIDPLLQVIAAEYDIHSSCDGVLIFRDQPWGEAVMRIGLEIKTASPKQFEDLKKPKLEHDRQTCVYMKCLNVPILWTMYINKGNQNVIPSKPPYLFTFDYHLWNQIESETKEVIHLATINEIPDRTESIVCQFCGYAWTCKPESLVLKAKREQAKIQRTAQQKRLRRIGTGGIRVPKTITAGDDE
jgi:hypothetical protein